MNAPYGEHFNYSVHNPLLTNIVKYINPKTKTNTIISIINLSMLFSFTLGAMFYFLIGLKYNAPPWTMIILAITISFFSPQIYRMNGHFSLAYTSILPGIYLLYLYCINFRWGHFILYATTFVLFFIHAYWGVLAVLLISTSYLIAFLKKWSARDFFLCLCCFTPLILFQIFIALTDHHIGRTSRPKGIFEYTSDFLAVALPNGFNGMSFEGISYMGFGLFMCAIFSLVLLVNKKQTRLITPALCFILIGVIIGTSSIFRVLPFLTENFDIFHQMRSIGRFMWLAHLGFVLILISGLRYFKGWQLLALILIILGEWVLEIMPRHRSINDVIVVNDVFYEAADEKWSEYEGLIYFPFFFKGSEHFMSLPSSLELKNAITLSCRHKVPLVNSYLSRTSIKEAREKLTLFSPVDSVKKFLSHWSKGKYLLFVDTFELNQTELHIQNLAKPMPGKKNLYEVDLNSFKNILINTENTLELIHEEENIIVKSSPSTYSKIYEWKVDDGGKYIVDIKVKYPANDYTPNKWDGLFILQSFNTEGAAEWISKESLYSSSLINDESVTVKVDGDLSSGKHIISFLSSGSYIDGEIMKLKIFKEVVKKE